MASFNTRVNGPVTVESDTGDILGNDYWTLAGLADALIVAYLAGVNLVDVDAQVEALQDELIAKTGASYTTV